MGKRLPGSCRLSEARVKASSAGGKAGVKTWMWLSVMGKTKQSEDQVYVLPMPGSAPPWSNAIFDCMSTMLQILASVLFR